MDHFTFLSRCCFLAKNAGKATKSNPLVGALLVHHGETIIGEGFHQKYGEVHAEVNCIHSVSEENKHLIGESTLYVSLEPCCISQKTPPCTNLILDHNIKQVVIGCLDPNPKVNGQGIKILKDNGVHVEVIHHIECAYIIQKFKSNLQNLPYVILKWAQSFDGYIGHRYEKVWISNEYSNFFSHKLRSELDGILVGKNTAILDNPKLNTRHIVGDNPMRVLLDKNLQTPIASHLLSDDLPTIIINEVKNETTGNKLYHKVNDITNLKEVLNHLYELNIYSILIEGGTTVLNSFIKANLWNEAYVIKSNKKLNELYDEKLLIPAPLIQGKLLEEISFGTDQILHIQNETNE